MSKKSKKDDLSCYEPFPREPTGSFEKFLFYRDLPAHERSTRKVAEHYALGKTSSEFKRIHKSIQTLCTKWCWVDRCRLYDADRHLELAKKKEGKFDELSGVMLTNIEALIKYANNLLNEVIKNPVYGNGEEYSLSSRIQMSKDVTSLLNSSHELLCNLCGRPSSYKNFEFSGEADLKADVRVTKSIDEVKKENKEYLKEIFKELDRERSDE